MSFPLDSRQSCDGLFQPIQCGGSDTAWFVKLCMKDIAASKLFNGILALSPCAKPDHLPCCESLRPMETPCIGAKPSNESKWALSWFQLCRVPPSLQIFPAGVQTWRSRVKLFILCPVWILDRRIFELNEMAVLKCPAKFEGDLLHSNSS